MAIMTLELLRFLMCVVRSLIVALHMRCLAISVVRNTDAAVTAMGGMAFAALRICNWQCCTCGTSHASNEVNSLAWRARCGLSGAAAHGRAQLAPAAAADGRHLLAATWNRLAPPGFVTEPVPSLLPHLTYLTSWA